MTLQNSRSRGRPTAPIVVDGADDVDDGGDGKSNWTWRSLLRVARLVKTMMTTRWRRNKTTHSCWARPERDAVRVGDIRGFRQHLILSKLSCRHLSCETEGESVARNCIAMMKGRDPSAALEGMSSLASEGGGVVNATEARRGKTPLLCSGDTRTCCEACWTLDAVRQTLSRQNEGMQRSSRAPATRRDWSPVLKENTSLSW